MFPLLISHPRVLENQFVELLSRPKISGNKRQWALGPINPVSDDPNSCHSYLEWLYRQATDSVIFVSFRMTTTLMERQVRVRDGTMWGRRTGRTPLLPAVTDMAGVLNGHPRSNFSNPDLSSQAVEAASIFPDLLYSAATHHHPDAFGGSTYQPVCTLILKMKTRMIQARRFVTPDSGLGLSKYNSGKGAFSPSLVRMVEIFPKRK